MVGYTEEIFEDMQAKCDRIYGEDRIEHAVDSSEAGILETPIDACKHRGTLTERRYYDGRGLSLTCRK